MTMMISKFHRLIQSKIIWGGFAIVISVAFVWLFTETPNTNRQRQEENSLGSLNGKPVSGREFQGAYAATRVQVAISMGRELPRTDEVEDQLREMAWKRLISLREAHDLELTVSDSEVLQGIQTQPLFHNDAGQFDPRIYAVFLNRFLVQQLGINQHQFEAFIREELLLQKMQQIVAQTILISPRELARAYRSVTDEFSIQIAPIGFDAVEVVAVTEAEAEIAYAENPDVFRLPERVIVDYVSFSIPDAESGFEISEESILEYYEANTNQFVAAIDATASTNEIVDAEVTSIKPLDEVRTEIVATLKREQAILALGEKSTDFVLAIQDAAYKNKSFRDVATEMDYKVMTTPPFLRNQPVEGISAGPSFNRDAFDLDTSIEASFSDSITGEEAIYVISLTERIPPEVPPFADVKESAMAFAQQEAQSEALVNFAEELHTKATEQADSAEAFSNLVTEAGLEIETLNEISASAGIPGHPNENLILRGILAQNAGELSDLIPTQNSLLLIFIADRIPAPPQDFSALRPRIVQNLIGERALRVFEGFQDYLLREAKFEERSEDSDSTEDLTS